MKTNFLSILKSNTVVDVIGDYDGGGSGSDELFRIYHSNTPANRLFTVLRNGNVGLNNASLEDWDSAYTALQIGGNASLMANTAAGAGSQFYMVQNAYFDDTDDRWEYQDTDEASFYKQSGGTHDFRVAALGNADDPITWIMGMQIDVTGKVSIGPTAVHDSLLHVWKASAGTVTAIADTIATLENNEDCYFSLLSGNVGTNKEAGFIFGTNGNNNVSRIVYNFTTLFMEFTVNSKKIFDIEPAIGGEINIYNIIDYDASADTVEQIGLSCDVANTRTLLNRKGIEFRNFTGAGAVTNVFAFDFKSDFIEDAAALQDDDDQQIPIMTPAGKRWLQVKELSV